MSTESITSQPEPAAGRGDKHRRGGTEKKLRHKVHIYIHTCMGYLYFQCRPQPNDLATRCKTLFANWIALLIASAAVYFVSFYVFAFAFHFFCTLYSTICSCQ